MTNKQEIKNQKNGGREESINEKVALMEAEETQVDIERQVQERMPDIDSENGFVAGFVSTRLDESAVDGVSLEGVKWAKVLNDMGATVGFFSGDTLKKRTVQMLRTSPEAGFKNTRGSEITQKIFKQGWATQQQKKELDTDKKRIKRDLKEFIKENNVDMLFLENLCFPANFALTDAVYEVLEETGMPYVMHHHDPAQERERFQTEDEWTQREIAKGILGPANNRPEKIFVLSQNTKNTLLDNYGKENTQENPLQRETGVHLESQDMEVVGNVMPFSTPPQILTPEKAKRFDDREWSENRRKTEKPRGPDKRPPEESIITTDQARDFRIKFLPDKRDTVFLMPFRIVPRKFPELGLEWTKRYHQEYGHKTPGNTVALFTHPWGDEDPQYWRNLEQFMREKKGFEHQHGGRGLTYLHTKNLVGPQNRFPLGVPYSLSDMALLPSIKEGWGNAIVESMYYRCPFGVNRFPIFESEIEGLGVECAKTGPDQLPPRLKSMKPGMSGDAQREFIHDRWSAAEDMVTDSLLEKTHQYITDPEKRGKAVKQNFQVGLQHLSYRRLTESLKPIVQPEIDKYDRRQTV